MRHARRIPTPGPIGRFAIAALVLFAAVGLALFNVLSAQLVSRQEQGAEFHASFTTRTLLAYEIRPQDLSTPLSAERQQELDTYTHQRVLVYPAVRIKVWRPDGMVAYSDEPRLIGRRFDNDEVARAAGGETVSEIEDSAKPENIYERPLGPKLFATYVPLRLGGGTAGAPDGVVEFYQDYAQIQSAVDQVRRVLVVTIVAALGLLYMALVPIARLTTRTEFERRRAVRQNTEKSRFLAFMSHELRTPLNSILGFAQLLEEPAMGALSERQARYVGNIRTSGQHLLALITDILDLSKIEAGAMDVELETVRVRELFDQVSNQVAPLAQRGQLDLRIGNPGDLAVTADPIRLTQVLLNLASNAIKFTPAEGTVTISAAGRPGWVDMAVADTGIGLTPEQLSVAFEPFVQVDGERTRKSSGTGLGLPLSRGLAENMGGRLEATSVPGRGSRFVVSLPAAAEVPAHPQQVQEERPTAAVY